MRSGVVVASDDLHEAGGLADVGSQRQNFTVNG